VRERERERWKSIGLSEYNVPRRKESCNSSGLSAYNVFCRKESCNSFGLSSWPKNSFGLSCLRPENSFGLSCLRPANSFGLSSRPETRLGELNSKNISRSKKNCYLNVWGVGKHSKTKLAVLVQNILFGFRYLKCVEVNSKNISSSKQNCSHRACVHVSVFSSVSCVSIYLCAFLYACVYVGSWQFTKLQGGMCRATLELHSADSALTTPPYKRESDLFFLALVRSCANFLFSLVLLKTLFLFQTPATRARKRAGTHTSAPPDCPPANGAQRPKHCNGNADAPRPAASERAHAQGLGRPQGGGGRAAPPRSRTEPCLLRVSSRPLSLRRIRHVSLRSQLILDLFLYNNISELIWDLSLSLFLFLSIVSPCARGYGERERSQVRGREREKCLRIKTYVHIYPLHKDEQKSFDIFKMINWFVIKNDV